MTDDKIATTLWFCEPCAMHGRATVRECDERPTMPCPYAGDGPNDCKRIGWSMRSWFCVRCNFVLRTATIKHSPTKPTEPCPLFPNQYGHVWEETPLSRKAMRNHPTGVEERART